MLESPKPARGGKRKAPSSEGQIKKRARLQHGVGLSKRQQATLTQINFVHTPPTSSEYDGLLQEIPVSSSKAARSRLPSVQKQNRRSTLTQMDWLNRDIESNHMSDDDLLPYLEDSDEAQSSIQQLDGPPDNLGKARKRKVYGRQRSVVSGTMEDDIHDGAGQSSIHLTKRPRTLSTNESFSMTQPSVEFVGLEAGKRRTSRAIRKKMDSIEQIQDPLIHKPETGRRSFSGHDPVPRPDLQPELSVQPPATPKRRAGEEIPSSQTPPTRFRIAYEDRYRSFASPIKKKITPLAERSVNLPMSKLPKHRGQINGLKSTAKSSRAMSDTLKMRRRPVESKRQQIEDSEDDNLSLSDTSPSQNTAQPQKSTPTQRRVSIDSTSDGFEIPPSSLDHHSSNKLASTQPLRYADTQSRHDDGSASVQLSQSQSTRLKSRTKKLSETKKSHKSTSRQMEAAGEEMNIIGNDDIVITLPEPSQKRDIVLYSETSSGCSQRCQVSDADSDLGSPVANDTQFNDALLQRSSSPIVIHDLHHAAGRKGTAIQSIKSLGSSNVSLTTPSLHSDETHMQDRRDDRMTKEWHNSVRDNASSATTEAAGIEVPAGTASSSLFPSSPSFRPIHLPIQGSIHPASMPPPSQISTQDPTQGLPLSSGTHLMSDPIDNETIEIYTIKDSNCSDVNLSQLPIYTSQKQDPHPCTQIIGDSEDEEDDLDLDLDPSSWSHHSARKVAPRQATGTANRVSSRVLKGGSSDDGTSVQTPRSQVKQLSENQDNSPEADRHLQNLSRGASTRTTMKCGQRAVADNEQNTRRTTRSSDHSWKPIPGFNNDTQSNFTQNGHVTAAYIHRQRENGMIPEWFTPQPYQLQAFRNPVDEEANQSSQ